MTQQQTITNIPETVAALWALSLTMTQKEMWGRFNQAREFLDKQPARDWNADTELKTAYEYGLNLLAQLDAARVAEFKMTHPWFYSK